MINKNNNLKKYIFLLSCFLSTICIGSEKKFNRAEYAEQKAWDLGAQTAGTVISVGLEKAGVVSPSQKAQKELTDKQTEHYEIQIAEAKIDQLTKQLDATEKFIETQNKKSSKEEREEGKKKGKIVLKRLEKKFDEIIKDLPELTEDELKELESDKKKSTQKNKNGLFAKLASSIALIGTKSGEAADLIASYTFARITNLDCFKDTFVAANAQTINRSLVALTALTICYGTYKTYNKHFSGAYDADDFFDNDDE